MELLALLEELITTTLARRLMALGIAHRWFEGGAGCAET